MKATSTKIAISQFKAHCLEIIGKLQANQQPIIITKRDKIVPLDTAKASLFGMLKSKAEIKADILESIAEKWDVEYE
jgi:hypothetical protein